VAQIPNFHQLNTRLREMLETLREEGRFIGPVVRRPWKAASDPTYAPPLSMAETQLLVGLWPVAVGDRGVCRTDLALKLQVTSTKQRSGTQRHSRPAAVAPATRLELAVPIKSLVCRQRQMIVSSTSCCFAENNAVDRLQISSDVARHDRMT